MNINSKHLLIASVAALLTIQALAQTKFQTQSQPSTPAQSKKTAQPRQFLLTGTIAGHDTGFLVLQYANDLDASTKDTAIINKGKFSFKGNLGGPVRAYLVGNARSINIEDPNRKVIFLEPGVMNISLMEGDFQHAAMTGSHTQDDMDELDRQKKPIRDSINHIKALGQRTADQQSMYLSFLQRSKDIEYTFINTHPNSFANPYIMMLYHNDGVSLDSAKKLYDRFSPEVKKSVAALYLKEEMIAEEQASKPDQLAPDFIRTDLHGRKIRLSAFRGKSYVLLDFWGSWCPHCRDLSPYIRKLYARYHKSGLEVISISNDFDSNAWKRAVAKDSIGIWTNIGRYRNESFPQDQIETKYSVSGYPTLVLIDKKGHIINRFLGFTGTADEIEQALQQVMPLPPSSRKDEM